MVEPEFNPMAKGFDRHRERVDALTALGRALARRSRSQCEICETGGVALAPVEIPPIPADPEIDHTAFLCELCSNAVSSGATSDPQRWRCLETAVWNETPVVQVAAVRLLRLFASKPEFPWAEAILDDLYLEDSVQSWVEDDRERDTGS